MRVGSGTQGHWSAGRMKAVRRDKASGGRGPWSETQHPSTFLAETNNYKPVLIGAGTVPLLPGSVRVGDGVTCHLDKTRLKTLEVKMQTSQKL